MVAPAARDPGGPRPAGGLLAGGYLLLQRLLLQRSVSGAGRTLHEVLLFSPAPEDLIRVNDASGATCMRAWWRSAGGVAVVALARRPPAGTRRIVWFFVPLLVGSIIVSVGPRLRRCPSSR